MKTMEIKKGQSLVEIAIIIPFVLFLILGIIDFGRAMLAYSTLNTAVREGTRMAVVGSSDTDINARIMAVCNTNVKNCSSAVISITTLGTGLTLKKRIIINYTFTPFIPWRTFAMTVRSEMYVAPKYR